MPPRPEVRLLEAGRYEELASFADLLLLGLYGRALNQVAKDDALRMKLHPATLVLLGVVDLDEFLAVRDHLGESHCITVSAHKPIP